MPGLFDQVMTVGFRTLDSGNRLKHFCIFSQGQYLLRCLRLGILNDLPEDFFKDVETVYVLAGLGGHTGTVWTPVIAQFVKFRNVKSVSSIVTTPFDFEGEKLMAHALDGLTKIKDLNLDLVIALNNEKLAKQYANINFSNAFNYADKAVLAAIEEKYQV